MPRRRAERIQPYIAREVRQRLARHCAGLGLTESAVVNEALTQYLDGTSDATLWMRRQDLLDRRMQRLARDVEILSQTVGMFLRIWFAHTPPRPKEAPSVPPGRFPCCCFLSLFTPSNSRRS